jgi:hypothetical protein
VTLRRLALPAATTAALLIAAAPAATAAPVGVTPPSGATTAAQAAAGWLATQLVDGNHLNFGTDLNIGGTTDAILAFDAAGVGQASAAKATAWLAGAGILTQYVGDGTTRSIAGAAAKAMLVAHAQGIPVTSFGGRDLRAALLARLATSGRFPDLVPAGQFDSSSVFNQSVEVLALSQDSAGAPAAAVSALTAAQCPDGSFPFAFDDPTCAPDADTTGLAVQALVAVGQTAAAGRALDRLAKMQEPDGGFKSADFVPAQGDPIPGVENSNTTGLVAQALRAGGQGTAADKAVTFLLGLQVGCGGPAAARGAIAFTPKGAIDAGAAAATAQAIPGVVGVPVNEISSAGAIATAPRLACAPPTTVPPTTAPPTTTPPTTTPATTASLPGAAAPGGGGGLANTGSPVGVLSVLAVALLGVGIGLVRAGRRRASRALPAR